MATSRAAPTLKVSRAPNLTEQVTKVLREEITGGQRALGEALPSEQAMSEAFGVSRTVMREAIARLKAEGLVVTRQGLGVFVAANKSSWPFRFEGSVESPGSVLKVVELRMGVEVEAAGLAAERRTKQDLREMKAALDEMSRAIQDDDLDRGVQADFNFHQALCKGTQNENFLEFFEFISRFLQNALYLSRYRSSRTKSQEYAVQTEHEAIYAAIAASDVEAARQAARQHIQNTAKRIRATPVNEVGELETEAAAASPR